MQRQRQVPVENQITSFYSYDKVVFRNDLYPKSLSRNLKRKASLFIGCLSYAS